VVVVGVVIAEKRRGRPYVNHISSSPVFIGISANTRAAVTARPVHY